MSATLNLLRQDPARGGLLRAIVSCLAAGTILRVTPDLGEKITELALDDLPGGFVPFYLLLTAMVATFILGSNAWTRSSRLALGLPVSTRKVWVVRTGSLTVVALFSITTLAVIIGLSIDVETGRAMMNPAIALAAARAAVTTLVLVFLYQLPYSERDRIPISPPYLVYIVCATLLTLLCSSAEITSMVGTLVLLAIAGALGGYLYHRLPSTFSISQTIEDSETPLLSTPEKSDLVNAGPFGGETLAVVQKHPLLVLHRVLFRGLKTNLLTWLLLLVVAASAAVVTTEFLKGTNAFVPLFFLIIYQMPLLQAALEAMTPFDALPIPRRVLFAHSVGPIIVSAALGVGIGLAIFTFNPRPFTQIVYSECCVRVPWDYLEISWDGLVPTITAAWGESYTPKAHPLWLGGTIALYDPYEVGADSSTRFVEFQMRRAVDAVYEIPVPREFSSPDYEAPPNIAGGVDRGGFTLDIIRGRMSKDRNRSSAVALLLLTILSTALGLTSLLQFGSSVYRKTFKWSSIGCIIFVVVFAIAVSAARLLGFTQLWYVGALLSIGVRSLAHWLPIQTSFLWIICMISWAGAYLLLRKVFTRIEFPKEKTMNRFAEEY